MRPVGHYNLGEELGRGGMGIVYRASDSIIGREVAIKMLPVQSPGGEEESGRYSSALLKEARAAGQLSHPNIVTVHHVIAEPTAVYVVMELVEGQALDKAMRGEGALSTERILSILAQAAEALDHAHAHGVIHRDVKPANFLVRSDGTVKLADFGIAKLTSSATGSRTDLVGTPHYMSPEHVQGQALDGASDQFSLAVVAWTLLNGNLPFPGETPVSVLYKIVNSEPVVPDEMKPMAPNVQAALATALSKQPQNRYRNCCEFVRALRDALTMTSALEAPRRGGRKTALAIGGLLAVALAVAAGYVWSKKDPREPVVSSPGSQAPANPPESAPPSATVPPPQTPLKKAPSPKPKSAEENARVSTLTAGILTWSGSLGPRASLTIDGTKTSAGTALGDYLPGRPARIAEVRPERVIVEAQPDAAGQWKRFVLNNTGAAVNDVWLRWELIQ